VNRALIAMSGGVDSAVAALLTREAGYACVGCTMKLCPDLPCEAAEGRSCCTADDASDARSVAFRLGMPHYVFNYTERFRKEVIGPFIEAYRSGQTPNPCVECNRSLKFGALLERAEELGCDCVVTGHYARIEEQDGLFTLKKGLDPARDQSYVLYMLSQRQLARIRFPLGALSKSEVRAIAAANGFRNAGKPDSQDICFVPEGDYAAVIERHTGQKAAPGDFVDRDGRVLGRHRGLIRYTVGQHRGLGLGTHERLCVLAIDPAANTVTLGPEEALYRTELTAGEFHWIAGAAPTEPLRCAVRTRYRQREQEALAVPLDGGRVKIVFDQAQRAITPGQSAVLYAGDTVLGGGIIQKGGEDI